MVDGKDTDAALDGSDDSKETKETKETKGERKEDKTSSAAAAPVKRKGKLGSGPDRFDVVVLDVTKTEVCLRTCALCSCAVVLVLMDRVGLCAEEAVGCAQVPAAGR